MNYLNWGSVQKETILFRGCKVVDCSGHGGIILSPSLLTSHPCFNKIKDYDFSAFRLSSGSYAFEEDMDANIILVCLPQSVLSQHYKACLTTEGYQQFIEDRLNAVKNTYPEIFTLITGIELSIFDSQSLFQGHLKNQSGLLFRNASFSGDNIPEGFIAIDVSSDEKLKMGQYLIPKDLHEKIKYPVGRLGFIPLDPSILTTPFELDIWTPSSRNKQAKADHYYISHIRKMNDEQQRFLVLAYNYQTQSKLCFEMTEQYYNSSNISDNGIQVDENLDVIDAPFINKSTMTAEQFIN